MHEEKYRIESSVTDRLNRVRQEGSRVIAVGTTSVRTLESAYHLESGQLRSGEGRTSIFIYPGYSFKMVQGLITNFHLPKSTLLMLVSAFAGRELMLAAYRDAVRERYRFFSYGDAMLIL
jgi:S-adenosylmethionine:tRNA ribosyltransferase-isomerase